MKPLLYDYRLSASSPFHLNHITVDSFLRRQVPDLHDALHFGILLSGCLKGEFAGVVKILCAHECYLTGAWEPHRTLESAVGYDLLLITVSPEELLKYFLSDREKLRNLFLLPFGRRDGLLNTRRIQAAAELYARVLLAMMQSDPEGLIQRKWHAICGLFVEIASEINEEDVASGLSAQRARLLPVIRAIAAADARRISVSEGAELCGLSAGRFAHLFRENFGIPFGVYELQYRLRGAANALYYEGAALKDAALQWGFHDESHLSKHFRKSFGVSPGEYRRGIPGEGHS